MYKFEYKKENWTAVLITENDIGYVTGHSLDILIRFDSLNEHPEFKDYVYELSDWIREGVNSFRN